MNLRRNFIKIAIMALSLGVYDLFLKPQILANLMESGYSGIHFVLIATVLGYLTVIMLGLALTKMVLGDES